MQRSSLVAAGLLIGLGGGAAPPYVTAGTLTPNAGNTAAAAGASGAAADMPARGANSFTRGQAQGRIADAGYTDVADLKLDQDGVWRGTALRDGKKVRVWMDYRGKVGPS